MQKQTFAKRALYVCAFTFLGVLLQFLVHVLLELATISLLLRDFDRYGISLSWERWHAVRRVLSALFLIVGAVFGYRWGVFWWRVLYIEHRYENLGWWAKLRAANA